MNILSSVRAALVNEPDISGTLAEGSGCYLSPFPCTDPLHTLSVAAVDAFRADIGAWVRVL